MKQKRHSPFRTSLLEAPATGTTGALSDLWLTPADVAAAAALEGDPIPTGTPPLDRQLRRGGLIPGTLTVIGGPAFSGKTTLCIQAILHMAQKAPVYGLFSDEGRRQAVRRMGVILGIPIEELDSNLAGCAPRIAEAMGERSIHLLKPEAPGSCASAVFARAASETPKGDPAIIALDSAQTIQLDADEDSDSERALLGRLSRACREQAERNGWIILLVSQSNRRWYSSRNPEENSTAMTAFAGYRFENDADLALVLGMPDEETRIVKVYFVKNRLGSNSSFDVRYTQTGPGAGSLLEIDTAERDAMALQATLVALRPAKEAIRSLLTDNPSGMSGRVIRDTIPMRTSLIQAALNQMVTENTLTAEKGTRGAITYCLRYPS